MKKEEEKSYSFLFILASLILLGSFIWVILDEVYEGRPWKQLQMNYFSLLMDRINDEIKEETEKFNSPEVQTKFQAVKDKLEKANENFKQSGDQEEYFKLKAEIQNISQKQLTPLQHQLTDLRNRVLEEEYLYTKYQSEGLREKRDKLKGDTSELVSKIHKVKNILAGKQKSLMSLTTEIEKYEKELTSYTSPLNKLQDKLKTSEKKRPSIQVSQLNIEELGRVDRCISCHVNIEGPENVVNEQPFKIHPGNYIFLKNHPARRFGCTICHEGQGRATTSMEEGHGNVKYWPNPMHKGRLVQSSCIMCHKNVKGLPGASLIEAGLRLFSEERGCTGCHDVEGITTIKIGPPLTFVGEKASYKWIMTWLKDPQGYYEKARMPNFKLSDKEVENIADFLVSLSRNKKDLKVTANPDVEEEVYQRGRSLYNRSRCVICHPTEGKGGAVKYVYAADHAKIANKLSSDWLSKWITNPKAYYQGTKMPHFRFSDNEVEDLVAFMSAEFIDWDAFEVEEESKGDKVVSIEEIDPASVETGRTLVKKYGCFGCHEIKGFEKENKIGADLTLFGSKTVEFLDFGIVQDMERSWTNWTVAKLKDPRQFREGIKMPEYSLTDQDLEALVCLLASFKENSIPIEYSAKSTSEEYKPQGKFGTLVRNLNCLVCHRIKGNGGDFAPELTYEGSRVTREWLVDFLKSPDIVRPLLKQMPKFNLTDQEVEVIADYIKIALVDDKIAAKSDMSMPSLVQEVEKGKEIYYEKGCQACHQIGLEGGAVGPNLSVVGDRLTPDYLYMHLKDPQRWGSSKVAPDYGLEDKEVFLLTRFLLNLRTKKVGFLR
ncbi:cytochrome c oxidase subunit 2 [Candidatus Scalindua japonica]|uniref:Cytochrome c oxidase subunit 2 n=1 Tax=Candidatus Scalindua japonica TaxID=1284222 RepID=A0A286U2S8_9BACT|nr:c-type cytochrome [Candidatus Scalindua japonica]GAX62436.1 cytochrome c oxidase subunit 2 [Candidatus Scalindua japonica]